MEENEFFFFVVFFLIGYNACKDIEQMIVPNVILGLHATGVVISCYKVLTYLPNTLCFLSMTDRTSNS